MQQHSPSETSHVSANVTITFHEHFSDEYVEQFNKSMKHTYKSREFVIDVTGVTDGCKFLSYYNNNVHMITKLMYGYFPLMSMLKVITNSSILIQCWIFVFYNYDT